MRYEVISAPVERETRAWKYGQLLELEIGQGIVIPYSDLSYNNHDPSHTVRTVAVYYAKKFNRKFRTEKRVDGILVVRVG